MIDRKHPQLSLRRQCNLLSLARSGLSYCKKGPDEATLALMHRLDELYTAHPFLGYRKLWYLVREEGHMASDQRVRRLLRRMGLKAIYQAPNTSKKHPANPIYPYLLKNLALTGPLQVWAVDITYIRLHQGFCYLVAIIDWFSRYVMSWRLSATMESAFCVEALQEALQRGCPVIFNSDQGSQFTSAPFTDVLLAAGIQISMDGRGSYHDNIFTERFWRSVKYEDVYLKNYETIEEARAGIGHYIVFYNTRRPHQALKYRTPQQVHFELAARGPVDMMDNARALPTSPQAQQLPLDLVV
jgi:putative transposase